MIILIRRKLGLPSNLEEVSVCVDFRPSGPVTVTNGSGPTNIARCINKQMFGDGQRWFLRLRDFLGFSIRGPGSPCKFQGTASGGPTRGPGWAVKGDFFEFSWVSWASEGKSQQLFKRRNNLWPSPNYRATWRSFLFASTLTPTSYYSMLRNSASGP